MPFGIFKIERENILIQLRRILGILYRAVRARPKPLSMLLDVGMIRCALECNIEGDLQSISFGAGDEFLEIFQRSQLRMNGSMAALFRTYRPGAAHIIWQRRNGIVFSLPESFPDRMDGRKIDNIETHGSNVGKPGLAITERSMSPSLRRA